MLLRNLIFVLFVFLISCGEEKSESQDNLKIADSLNETEFADTIFPSEVKVNETSYKRNSDFIVDKYLDSNPFENREVEMPKKIRDSLIYSFDSTMPFLFKNGIITEVSKKSFHFMHLNDDEKIDLLYCGWGGSEADFVVCYFNRGDRFQQMYYTQMKPLQLNFQNNRLVEMVVEDAGCCASYMTTISQYKVDDSIHLTNEYVYLHDTEMDGEIIKPQRFKINNEKYFIRGSPMIDDTCENVYYDKRGNILGTLSKGISGTAYKESKDSTGRVWWLIETEPLDSLANSAFYDSKDFPTSYIGWISSRFVKIIN